MLLRHPSWLLLAASLLLGACNPLGKASYDTLKTALFDKQPQVQPTPEQVASSQFPMLLLDTPYGSATFNLWQSNARGEHYITATRETLVLQDGLITRLHGFPEGTLQGIRFIGPSPFAQGLNALPDGFQSERRLYLMPGYRQDIPLYSTFKRKGLETIRILDQDHALQRIEEQVESPLLKFKARNIYWVDPKDGYIHHSLQHPLPGLPLAITQLKPAHGGAQ